MCQTSVYRPPQIIIPYLISLYINPVRGVIDGGTFRSRSTTVETGCDPNGIRSKGGKGLSSRLFVLGDSNLCVLLGTLRV